MRPYWVLDTGALMAFVHGVDSVGGVVADVADVGGKVAVPLVCLLEAYSLLDHDEHALLRVLRQNRRVETVRPASDAFADDDCPVIGSMTRLAGRLGAGHAAYVALVHAAGVVTSRPDQVRTVLGEDWPVLEV
jgi:hypothetical protein